MSNCGVDTGPDDGLAPSILPDFEKINAKLIKLHLYTTTA